MYVCAELLIYVCSYQRPGNSAGSYYAHFTVVSKENLQFNWQTFCELMLIPGLDYFCIHNIVISVNYMHRVHFLKSSKEQKTISIATELLTVC